MKNYRERAKDLLLELGVIDNISMNVSELPLEVFDKKEKINFSKVRGSVRLINKKVMTVLETDVYIDKVLQLELP